MGTSYGPGLVNDGLVAHLDANDFKSYPNKSAAQAVLEKAGYTVKSSVTNAVTILINESGIDSAKTNNARAKGVRIITNIKEIL